MFEVGDYEGKVMFYIITKFSSLFKLINRTLLQCFKISIYRI